MKPFLQNRFVKAALALVVFSALTHIAILIFIAIHTGDLAPLNYFNMLDIEYFLPAAIEGAGPHALSALVAAIIYFIFFAFFSRRNDTSSH